MNRAAAIVDLSAIRANLDVVRSHAGSADVMAVVKADAYGHGMESVARTARQSGISWLGVALPSEALTLRAMGDDGRILAWLWSPGDPAVASCVAQGIDLSVSTIWAVQEVAAAARASGQVARVHLKVDTGLSRNGATMSQLPDVLAALRSAVDDGDVIVEGLWTHLADGDTPGADSVGQQRENFEQAWDMVLTSGLEPRLRHVANSGAVFAHPECHYDLVRTGIAMYGLTPARVLGTSDSLGLTPAMMLAARLAHIKEVDAGTAVSYGWRWSSETSTRLGLVPLGYADGVPRAAGAPRTGPAVEVTLHGQRHPIVGTVAMDQFVIDLGSDSGACPGDEVLLFGPGAQGEWTADEWADAVGTIGYEIVTRIGARVDREYRGEVSEQRP